MNSYKIFHDTVHGDIQVSSIYCKNIIDTVLFQRLRRIEQTSIRSLYPCARHDRFIHSLGVFHLGNILINNIEINTRSENYDGWNTIFSDWKKISISFNIACLLHDIGHSPFSHTFEHYFDLGGKRLDISLKEEISDISFSEDVDNTLSASPHEKVSAIITKKVYQKSIEELGGNYLHIVRMILGVKYCNPVDIEQKVVNCLIPLLHGIVDVDRLDYACRDQWASGYSSARINVTRIITSGVLLFVDDGSIRFCFYKKAIRQIESLINIKKYMKRWIFPHHKIVYDQNLLTMAVDKMAQLVSNEKDGDLVLGKIFNLSVFTDEKYSFNDLSLYLLSDDDIIHLMKSTYSNNEFARQWLTRDHYKKPLWKSEAEFLNLFSNASLLSKEKIFDALKASYETLEFEVLDIGIKKEMVLAGEISIFLNNEIVDYLDVQQISNGEILDNQNIQKEESSKQYIPRMIYAYVDEQHFSKRDEIVQKIRMIS